ncbi:unnamed protein product, partial [Symbiodinium sp. CCMP2456]
DTLRVAAGTCIHIVPVGHPVFAVAYLEDMLLSPDGWLPEYVPPRLEGSWLYLVNDDEPCLLKTAADRRLALRADIAAQVGYPEESIHVYPGVPRVGDFYEYGAGAQQILIVTQLASPEPGTGVDRSPFILDLRPIHCGITWGFARLGRVESRMLVERFSDFCPAGYYVSLSGGRQRLQFEGLFFEMQPGEVMTVDFRRELVDDSGTDDEGSTGASDSSNPSPHRNGEAPPPPPASQDGQSSDEDSPFRDAREPDARSLRNQPGKLTIASAGRVIPTPARAHQAQPAVLHADEGTSEGGVIVDGEEEVVSGAEDCITSGSSPQTIDLAECVPLSPFQQQVLSLHAIIPATVSCERPGALVDWLDSDLRGLRADPLVPQAKLQLFESISLWANCSGEDCPTDVVVYTDGSARSGQDIHDISPGGWAVSVWVRCGPEGREHFVGCASDVLVDELDNRFVGASEDDPLVCEQLALAWGFAWVIEFGPSFRLPVTIRYDCLSAGRGAFGVAKAPRINEGDATSAMSLFLCYLRQLAEARVSLTHDHIRAHAGHVANELCDELAKRARRCEEACSGELLPLWPGQLFRHPLKAWAWLPASGTCDLPALFSFETEASRLQQADLVGSEPPSMGKQCPPATEGRTDYRICVVTANVLTLLDPKPGPHPVNCSEGQGLRVTAKREVLKRQFNDVRALLIGLQETRLREAALMPDGQYFMLHAPADDDGHHGVALWVSKEHPYAYHQGKPLFLQLQHMAVTVSESRLMVVQICAPKLSWTVVVAHAPSDSSPDSRVARAFWNRCRKALSRKPAKSEIVLLADANARVGSLPSDSIGGCDHDEESLTGQVLHQFAVDEQLWLPSTFSGCHTGPSPTWVSPAGQAFRIDYIGVPLTWPESSVRTWVWREFESLQVRDDHFPLVLQADFNRGALPEGQAIFRRQAIRPPRDAPSEDYVSALTAITRMPAASWGVGVDEHFKNVVQAWQEAGQLLCERPGAEARQTYLSDDTLRLVSWRKAWRRRLRALKESQRGRRLAACLLAWVCYAGSIHPNEAQGAALWTWARGFDVEVAQAAMLVSRLGRVIKGAAKADRVAYLGRLVEDVSLADLKDPKILFQRVRKAFPQTRPSRRPLLCPLPAVQGTEGELACSAADRFEQWRAHFATQEAGDQVADPMYIASLRDQKGATPALSPVFDLHCIPTLTAVEQTLCGLPFGKAAGYDKITGELLRVHAPSSARLLTPLYAKAALGLYEPIEFRGGALIPLAKRAAASMTCEKFRSVLVSSLPGKIYHRQLRTMLLPALQRVRGDTQAGAIPGISTEAIAMVARSFRDIMSHRRQAWALTFFDVRAAYYRVIRQVLLEVGDTEKALRRLMHDLGVPHEAFHELLSRLTAIGAVTAGGTSEHLRGILSDALQGTWFRLDLGSALTITHRGVRPGDSLADVLFAFTFSAYVASTDRALEQAGLSTAMPDCGTPSLWSALTPPPLLGCGSWADDFVQMTAHSCPSSIASRVTRIVGVFAEQAESVGIQLTFAPDKTATMLSHVEGQVPPVSRDDEGLFLSVCSSVTGMIYRLPIVDAYRHLGGIATTSGTPVPEIGYRHSLAMLAVRPLRSRLYSAYGIPLEIRRNLLRSLAVSRYIFGSAALPLHTAIHRRLWSKHYVALWRHLWRRGQGEHYRHCFAVLGPAGAPPPPLALAMSRAVLLRQITAHGPATLQQLLHVQRQESPKTAWLGSVQRDIEHVAQYVPAARTLLGTQDPVRSLVEAISDDNGWWVRQIKAANKLAVSDMVKWVQARPGPSPEANMAGNIAGDGTDTPGPSFQHQAHLKHNDECLLQSCLRVPHMPISEVREVESAEVHQAKCIRRGAWEAFSAALPTQQCQGPKVLTAEERITLLGEDLDLGLLSRLFRPDPTFLSWVISFIQGRSKEGPKGYAASFWDVRPGQHQFHPNSRCYGRDAEGWLTIELVQVIDSLLRGFEELASQSGSEIAATAKGRTAQANAQNMMQS